MEKHSRFSVLAATFVIAAMSMACNGGERYPDAYEVRISPEMTAAEQQIALEAMAEWTGSIMQLSLSPVVGECPSDPAREIICIGMAPDGDLPGAWGVTSTSKIVLINGSLGLSDDQLRQTMAHELGHAMGLIHTGAGTLMAPSEKLGAAMTVTAADVDQWNAVR